MATKQDTALVGQAEAIKELWVCIRWLIRRDMPEVFAIEQASFEFPWSEEDFVCCLRQRNCIGMVAEQGEKIVGFVVYELHKSKLYLLNFAVHPEHRRCGIGARMVETLLSTLSSGRRTRIVLEVRETNLHAQLFFRSLGFRATDILRGFYDYTSDDAYVMEYRHGRPTGYLPDAIRERLGIAQVLKRRA